MIDSVSLRLEPRPAVAGIVSVGLPLGLVGGALRLLAGPIPMRERTATDVAAVLLGHALAGVALVGAFHAFAEAQDGGARRAALGPGEA